MGIKGEMFTVELGWYVRTNSWFGWTVGAELVAKGCAERWGWCRGKVSYKIRRSNGNNRRHGSSKCLGDLR